MLFSKINSICGLLLMVGLLVCSPSLSALAEEDYAAQAQARKELPIQSNQVSGWPEGPAIGAEGAILMDANNGTILYAKNMDERLYPASTTKILTCLLAVEHGSLDETVTFSYNAVHSVEEGGSNMGIDAGEKLTLEECLYGILVGSANEAANAVAEHIGGDMDTFVEMMNAKAAELGCKNTHFVNANGLYDDDHYTSAYDLAIIARAFFDNELLCRISNTASYHFTPTATQPDDFYLHNKHQLVNGEIPYEGIVGGKTGYTGEARQTLVTCAERDGMKLICVILKEESPAQFTDTTTLFDYGFNNFQVVPATDVANEYLPGTSSFFYSDSSIFDTHSLELTLSSTDYILLPKTADIADADVEVVYDHLEDDAIAGLTFSYHGVAVGDAGVQAIVQSTGKKASDVATGKYRTIYVNVKYVVLGLVVLTFGLIFLIHLITVLMSYHFGGSGQDRRRFHRRKKEAKGRGFGYKDLEP